MLWSKENIWAKSELMEPLKSRGTSTIPWVSWSQNDFIRNEERESNGLREENLIFGLCCIGERLLFSLWRRSNTISFTCSFTKQLFHVARSEAMKVVQFLEALSNIDVFQFRSVSCRSEVRSSVTLTSLIGVFQIRSFIWEETTACWMGHDVNSSTSLADT